VHLKQIELLGFKSFPHKTAIRFSDGVTAIVGPNGCGKTNILDALRWVLGEQKPTMLRGGKMEEVIFNGTGELKPLGMAEVTLSVVNDHGILPTEYHEVQITRRLFRSGESEYLLNKIPCRLKDILDLFADTGMGAHSYSVIQQHMIDSVISDKAEERRFLFEEAAGITKYKQRRKAALRKLEATENDFLRLKDVYAEVKTRVNSLYRQHKKAERYQKLNDEIRAWDLFLNSTRSKILQDEKRRLRAAFDALSDQRSGKESALDHAYAGLETERQELVGLEQQLTEIGNQIYTVTEEAHRKEREISVLNEKQANARLLISRNKTDIEALTARQQTLAQQGDLAAEELERNRQEHNRLSKELASAQETQAEVDRQLMAGRMAREEKNKRLFELEGRLSSGKAEENNLREQEQELAATLGEIDSRVQEILPHQTMLLRETEQLRAALDELKAKKAGNEHRQADLALDLEAKVETNEELTLELSDLSASLEACEARKTLLEDMILQYEGYEAGVVAAMDVKDRWPSIAGTVADEFVPVAGMESALEAALGDVAGFLLCRDRHDAQAIIQYVRSERKGKIGILVPHTGTISPAFKRPELNMPGVVGWLDNFVSTSEGLRPLKEAVLARTVVLESGVPVDQILERLPYGFGAVTIDGVLYGSNLIAGGSDDEFPLFRRREKVAEQVTMIEELRRRIELAREGKNQNTARIAALRAESTQLITELESLDDQVADIQHKLGECEFQNRTLSADHERLTREKQGLLQRIEKIRGRQYTLGLDADQLTSQKATLVDKMGESGGSVDELEQRANSIAEEVSRLQVATIEARSRCEQTESQITHLREIIDDLVNTGQTRTGEIEQAERDILQAGDSIARLTTELHIGFEGRDQLTTRQEELRQVQSLLAEQTSAKERQARQLRQEKDSVAEELHKTEIRLTTIESEIASLTEKMRDEYQVDLSTVITERPDEAVSDDQAQAHVMQLKETLRALGAVNLLALEEYQVTSEREKFLGEQLTDLTKAKNDLKATITKINQTARHLFDDTFGKVRENFRNLFVELFKGGEADISLVDPEDPLESDINIVARPGGKKLLPITILSGGERALTSIALLFSLYLVKPSPFCILDEIDAPLDDANCHRFLTIIRNFSKRTQFIIITHNKITMQTSNNLYGVTMERPGVSKLVAVKFADNDGNGDGTLVTVEADQDLTESDAESGLPPAIQERMNPDVTIARDRDE
jgi:chromosome segregation protein